MLIKGELDGAFIHDGCASDKVREIFSFTEDFALISSINITDINNINTPIILNSDTNCPYRKLLQKWFAYNNSPPTSTIEFDTLESILKGIAEGLGVSLLPKSILPENHNFLVYDLNGKFNKPTIKFIINKYIKINSLLKNFINTTKEYASNSVG